jgi:hypothetical protein
VATALLETDKQLSRWRWDIVPGKITEERFWKHYFYRVHLLMDSFKGAELNVPKKEEKNVEEEEEEEDLVIINDYAPQEDAPIVPAKIRDEMAFFETE